MKNWAQSHLEVHVLLQQSSVEDLVFHSSVTVADPFSFQHVYSLKCQTGGHNVDRKDNKKKNLQATTEPHTWVKVKVSY